MEMPKFLLGDNTDFPEDIFIMHLEYPRLVINLKNDQVYWLEDLGEDQRELAVELPELIELASGFYDREMGRYEQND